MNPNDIMTAPDDEFAARPIQPEEEAVIEIVRRLFARGSAAGPHDYQKRYSELESAVRALPPKAVRPEDCEPGTRFEFEISAGSLPAIKMTYEATGVIVHGYRWEDGHIFRAFSPGDRIIPIEEDQ